jgi:hypothetical protein
VAFLIPAAALTAAGALLHLAEVRAGVVLIGLGIGVFVVGAWILAHPERGGEVGHPDINPWSVG